MAKVDNTIQVWDGKTSIPEAILAISDKGEIFLRGKKIGEDKELANEKWLKN